MDIMFVQSFVEFGELVTKLKWRHTESMVISEACFLSLWKKSRVNKKFGKELIAYFP
jgi:hypothetical protein